MTEDGHYSRKLRGLRISKQQVASSTESSTGAPPSDRGHKTCHVKTENSLKVYSNADSNCCGDKGYLSITLQLNKVFLLKQILVLHVT